jgi:hypothetical protein
MNLGILSVHQRNWPFLVCTADAFPHTLILRRSYFWAFLVRGAATSKDTKKKNSTRTIKYSQTFAHS